MGPNKNKYSLTGYWTKAARSRRAAKKPVKKRSSPGVNGKTKSSRLRPEGLTYTSTTITFLPKGPTFTFDRVEVTRHGIIGFRSREHDWSYGEAEVWGSAPEEIATAKHSGGWLLTDTMQTFTAITISTATTDPSPRPALDGTDLPWNRTHKGPAMTYAQKLRLLREEEGFTHENLAQVIGVEESELREYETTGRLPSFATAVRIARAMGISVAAFEHCTDVAVRQ